MERKRFFGTCLGLILLIGFASASSISVDSAALISSAPVLQSVSSIDFNVNVSAVDLNYFFDLKARQDNNSFVLSSLASQFVDVNSTKILTISVPVSGVLSPGIKNIVFYLDNIIGSDPNISDNNKTLNVEVFEGKNLEIQSIGLNVSSPDINQSVDATITVINSGDITVTEAIVTCVSLNSLQISCHTQNNDVDEGELYSFIVPFTVLVSSNTLTAITDSNSLVSESNESDNSKNLSFVSGNIADLVLLDSDITLNPNQPIQNQTLTATIIVKNAGNVSANNFSMKAYRNNIQASNLLQTTTISLQAGETINFSTSFSPASIGNDSIIFIADYENAITEANENNNQAAKNFSIIIQSDSGSFNYPKIFEVRNECQVLFSNGDAFLANYVGKTGGFEGSLEFELNSASGNEISSGSVGEGYEEILSGRTLKVIDISENFARILLTYTFENTIVFSNCATDVASLITEIDEKTTKLNECQVDLIQSSESLEIRQATDDKLNSCELQKIDCQSTLQNKIVALSDAGSECNSRVASTQNQEQTKKTNELTSLNALIFEKDKQINSKEFEKNLALMSIGGMLILFAAYHFLNNRDALGGLGGGLFNV